MPGTTDTVKAKLTPGEFVIRKEAVDMIGVPMLNKLNDMPEEGGHSAIDSLIQKATLSNMKMMYGGGMVQPNYAGGGMIEDEYMKGGKVKKGLKPVPQGNPGLGKLPEMVRNKMGYMEDGGLAGYQSGGKVMDYITDLLSVGVGGALGGNLGSVMARRALAKRNAGDIKSDMPFVEEQIDAPMIDMEAVLNRKKAQDNAAFSMIPTVGEFKGQRIYQGSPEMSSYLDSDAHSQYIKSKFNFQQGGLINYQDGGLAGYENGGSIYGMNRTPKGMMQAVYEMPTDDGNRYYLGEASRPQLNLSRQVARSRAEEKAMNMPQDSISFDMVQQLLNPESPEPEGKKGLMGLLGFQDGGMIGPPVPPEMMGQAMNQQLGDSIDMRMANPQMGGALGMMRQESEAIEAAMKDNIARNARLALQKIKVDSLMQMEPQGMSIPDSLITNPQSLDNGFLRLLQEMNQSKGVRIPRPSTLR